MRPSHTPAIRRRRKAKSTPVVALAEVKAEKSICPFCHHEFVPWLLPASGQYAKSCPFCSIIALHLFNKTPMPQWLSDYRAGNNLSAREYALAVTTLQKLLT